MAISMSSTASCIKPEPSNTWKWGLGGGSAWLQYGDHERSNILFSVLRSPVSEATQLILHDASAALSKTQEIPGFIDFSFEGGSHAQGGKKGIVAVDGVAILQKLQSGSTGLIAGNLHFPDPTNMKLLYKASKATRGSFRFYAAETCYEIPLPAEPLHVMKILFSPHESFSKEAVKIFLE
jgi:hypothetical protein